MNRVFLYGLTILLMLNGERTVAADDAGALKALRDEISAEVSQAAKEAQIEMNANLRQAFIDAASRQSADALHVYKTVPKESRINRIAEYLAAKKDVEPMSRLSVGADFHWGYVGRDLHYSPVRLRSAGPVTLQIVESRGTIYSPYKGGTIKPGEKFILPSERPYDVKGTEITVTFNVGESKGYWSGSPSSAADVYIKTAGTTRGAEIFVNSNPSGAKVYFNRREWYQLTNTSSVRDPGIYEVRLVREGYKEWAQKRHLAPGDTWTIDVVLNRK